MVSDIKTKVFSVGHGIGNMTSIKLNPTWPLKKHFSRATVSHALYCWSFIFWSTCLSSFMVFLPFSIFLKWRVERKVLHSDEGISLWKFFFIFYFFFFYYLDSLSIDLGPRPKRTAALLCWNVSTCSQNTEENGQHQSFL